MGGPVRRLDDNLELHADAVHCSRCGALVGTDADWLANALVTERPATEGNLLTAPPELFVDAPVVLRQACCPGCLTLLLTEVIAADHRGRRTKKLRSMPVGQG